jgi:Tol biopolymer transport system component
LDPIFKAVARAPDISPGPQGLALQPGMILGPYQIGPRIGSGGMGEVYRARDPRLGRDVAIKVLSDAGSATPEQVQRFDLEARAAGALSHPNVLAVFDIGRYRGAPFLVFELLEGETLRQRLETGALPASKAIDFSIQIAHGLAAAHEHGIVHRDLKPENVFVTRDGRVKILDFGLAKLERGEDGDLHTLTTRPGVVLGTVGYMAPEQVQGLSVDARGDLFALGAILYEMLSGTRAFRGDSEIDTLNAILNVEPPPLAVSGLSPVLARIVRHCLEKNPAERFQSARDLAFDLQSLSSVTRSSPWGAAAVVRNRRRGPLLALGCAVGIAVVGPSAYWLGERQARSVPAPLGPADAEMPAFRPVTYRRGFVTAARFAPDGQTVVFGARFRGEEPQVFTTRLGSAEFRPLGVQAQLLALSAQGELALGVRPSALAAEHKPPLSTLARVPLAGGAPRELLESVVEADWLPDGTLAVYRRNDGRHRIEFPIGNVVYRTDGMLSHLRVSPDGEYAAFMDHPTLRDDRGHVVVVDRAGRVVACSQRWASEKGLAWSADGREVWFTAARVGVALAVHALSLDGRHRVVVRVPTPIVLHDIARDGRVLIATRAWRHGVVAKGPDAAAERDLSWLDFSRGMDLSDDGRWLLLDESGAGGGPGYSVYLRNTDGSPAIRLGDGLAGGLSPDGKWALAIALGRPRQVVLLPTGPGAPRVLTRDHIDRSSARFLPDGKRIFFQGSEPGRPPRGWVQDIAGGAARPITPEGAVLGRAMSPDSRWIIATNADGKLWLYPIDGGKPEPVRGLAPENEEVLRFGKDPHTLLVLRCVEKPAERWSVERLDLVTLRREPVIEISPFDRLGTYSIQEGLLSADGKSYAYTYHDVSTELYLATGLR